MRLVPALLLGSLAACATVDRASETATRNAAKSTINAVVKDRAPGMDLEPISDCVIENATRGELLSLASAALTGVLQSTVSTVLEISGRPGTILCLSRAGLGQLTI